MNVEPFNFDGDYGDEYEEIARQVIPGYETLFPMFAAIIEPEIPRGGRVLVVGAGTGIEIVTLKRARPDLAILGVDPSDPMLERARSQVRWAGVGLGVSFHLGYTHELPPEPEFAAATLINVLHFVPDDGGKAALLTDIAERLRPDAPFVLFDLHGDPTSMEYARYMPAWRRFWALRGMGPDDVSAFESRIRGGIHFASSARLLELAKGAGFESPRMFYKSLLYGGWTFRRGVG